MTASKFYGTGRKAQTPSTTFFRHPTPARGTEIKPLQTDLAQMGVSDEFQLGFWGKLKVGKLTREAMARAVGDIMVNKANLIREAVLHDGELHLSQHKMLALRDYLAGNTTIAADISRISREAEREMITTFHGEFEAILDQQRERLEALDRRAESGIEPRMIDAQREAIERWSQVEIENIEARMTIILQRYAQAFEAALRQFVRTKIEEA